MKYHVYILESIEYGQYYIGQTQDLDKRIEKHNKGYVKSTKGKRPWKVLFSVECDSRSESMALEKKLKGFKSRKRIIKWIEDHSTDDEGVGSVF